MKTFITNSQLEGSYFKIEKSDTNLIAACCQNALFLMETYVNQVYHCRFPVTVAISFHFVYYFTENCAVISFCGMYGYI